MLSVLLVLALQSDADVARLVERLGADFLEERLAARRELEKLGPRAEPALLEALASADHRVRRAGLEILAGLKSTRARAKAAVLFASDDDASVQESAFRLLQALGAEAEEDLIAALAHPSPEFRRGAVESLRTLQSPKSVKPLSDLYDRETAAPVKEAVFRTMLSMPGLAEAFLLKGLGSPEVRERREILAVLRTLESPAVLDRVGKGFPGESDPEALRLIAEILEKAGPRAEAHWNAGLDAPKEAPRILAAQGLKTLKSRAGAAKAGRLVLSEPSDAVREALADYLAAVGGPEAEAAFLKGLKEGSPAVRALAIRKLGELKLAGPLPEVAKTFRSEKDPALRRACFDYLASLGRPAEQELLQALSDEDKLFRLEAAKALGEAGSELAIPRLLLGLEDLDAAMRAASESALARLGTKALDAAREAATQGRLKPRALEALEALVNRDRVERELDRLVTDQGGTGFFAGQFQALLAMGKDVAGPTLLRIAGDPRHVVRVSSRRDSIADYDALIRGLAITALGELGVPGAKELLQRLAQENEATGGDPHTEALLALHRLGDPAPLDRHLKMLSVKVESGLRSGEADEETAVALFTTGLLLNRAGRRAEAAAAYERLVTAASKSGEASKFKEDLPLALYNLACLAALGGDKPRGVDYLARAVKAGYKDRAWIEMDKDLDGLRGEAAYRDLLADESLLPKASAPK